LEYFQRIVTATANASTYTLELMRQVSQGVATDRAVCGLVTDHD